MNVRLSSSELQRHGRVLAQRPSIYPRGSGIVFPERSGRPTQACKPPSTGWRKEAPCAGSGKLEMPTCTRRRFPPQEVRGHVLDDLLRLFGGRAQTVMAHLVESGKLTREDIRETEKLIDELEREEISEEASDEPHSEPPLAIERAYRDVALAAWAMRRNSPRARYWLWLAASAEIPASRFRGSFPPVARVQLPPDTPSLPRAYGQQDLNLLLRRFLRCRLRFRRKPL